MRVKFHLSSFQKFWSRCWAMFELFVQDVENKFHLQSSAAVNKTPQFTPHNLETLACPCWIWMDMGDWLNSCRFVELLHPWTAKYSTASLKALRKIIENMFHPFLSSLHVLLHAAAPAGRRKKGSCFPSPLPPSHPPSSWKKLGTVSPPTVRTALLASEWGGSTISVQGHLVQDKTGRIEKFPRFKFENGKYDRWVFNEPSRACMSPGTLSPSKAEILGPKQSIQENS